MFDATNTTATTSTIIAASVAPVVTQVQNEAGHKSAVATKRSAPSNKSLSHVSRAQAKADQVAGSIGDAMQVIGETIGYYTVEKDTLQADTTAVVQKFLKQSMKQGLTVAMLKAPSKANPSECYVALVGALQTVRTSAGLKPLADATRDNYMSRIRNFVRDAGVNPLDLFGNLATTAKKEEDKKVVEQAKEITAKLALAKPESEEDEDQELSEDTGKQFTGGIPALHAMLKQWHTANDVGLVAEKYRAMVADMINLIETELPFVKEAKKIK